MLKTIDVKDGAPLPDVSNLDAPAALARKRDVEARLGAIRGDDSRTHEREQLKALNDALSRHLGELREAEKRERTRRTFAGIGTPLYEAVAARFDAATVAELERDAMARLGEREQRSAEKRAKGAK
jgi:hypothetical protein